MSKINDLQFAKKCSWIGRVLAHFPALSQRISSNWKQLSLLHSLTSIFAPLTKQNVGDKVKANFDPQF